MKQYTNRDWLYKMYVTNELSIESISKICDVCVSLIHRYLVRFEIPRRRFCGKSGIKCGKWKGGRTVTTSGYIYIYQEGHPRARKKPYAPYVPEQILMVEKHLGRLLKKEEVVHHINEIKNDNRIENLYLFPSESDHQRYHQKLRRGSGEPITKSNLLF